MTKKLFNELESTKRHSISDFLLDEEANIPKGRLLTIGSLMVVLACMLGIQDAFAKHESHGSHRSHSSGSGGHSSHSSGGYGHESHSSHRSHSSHSSSSHSNHASGHSSHLSHSSGGGYGHNSHVSGGHSSHSSVYNYHSNAAPAPSKMPATAPILPDVPDILKIPQILPDTISP